MNTCSFFQVGLRTVNFLFSVRPDISKLPLAPLLRMGAPICALQIGTGSHAGARELCCLSYVENRIVLLSEKIHEKRN